MGDNEREGTLLRLYNGFKSRVFSVIFVRFIPFFVFRLLVKVTKNEKISSPVCLLSVKNRLIFFDIGHFDQKVKNENCMNLTIIMKYLQKSCSCDM